jgi:hypothetical protein
MLKTAITALLLMGPLPKGWQPHRQDGVSLTPVVIAPTSASKADGETQQFTATGGMAPYTWSIFTNVSGGGINGSGLYTAGNAASGVDVVRVTDNFSQTADANVTVTVGSAVVFKYAATKNSDSQTIIASPEGHWIGENFNGTNWVHTAGETLIPGAGACTASTAVPMSKTAGFSPFRTGVLAGLASSMVSSAASDVCDFTGDATWCAFVTYEDDATGSGQNVITNGTTNAGNGAGWGLMIKPDTRTARSDTYSLSTVTRIDAASTTWPHAPNLICATRDIAGNTQYTKGNLGAIASGAGPKNVSDTNRALTVPIISAAMGTRVMEFWCENTALSDANLILLFKQEFGYGLTLPTSTNIAFTRSGSNWLVANGTAWQWPDGAPRINESGLYSEAAGNNKLTRSEDFSHADWTKSSVTVAANSVAAPVSSGTQALADTLTSTGAGGYVESVGFTSSSSEYISSSVWVKSAAGTVTVDLVIRNTTDTSDQKVCSRTATTTWTRVYCDDTSLPPNTKTMKLRIYPGGVSSAGTEAVYAWGAQLESKTFAYSQAYHRSTTAAVTTAADAATSTAGQLTNEASFCLGTTFKPGEGKPWTPIGASRGLMSEGDGTSADTMKLEVTTAGNLVFTVNDAAAGVKTATVAHGMTDGEQATVVGCANGGVLDLYKNGVTMSATRAGAGTGTITTHSTTINLCQTGANKANGYCKNSAITDTGSIAGFQ